MTERPDGGWGWIIAIAAFLNNVIVDGVKYSFGIMFVELVETFHRSKSETSWIMSIQVGIMLLSGPIVAALVNRFECKTVALAGTVLSFSGFIASIFARSLYVMYVTFGLLAGFGFGMMTMPIVVMLANYFNRRLAFASGIAAMGSGFGTLVFNPLSKVLIDKYTWRGALLVESGIVLNGLVCALVMKSPKKMLETRCCEEKIKEGENVETLFEVDHSDTSSSNNMGDGQELIQEANNDETTVISQTFQVNKNPHKDTEGSLENSDEVKLKESANESRVKETYETDVDCTAPLLTTSSQTINKVTNSGIGNSDKSHYENKFLNQNDCSSVISGNNYIKCKEILVEINRISDNEEKFKRSAVKVPVINVHRKEHISTYDTNSTNNIKTEAHQSKRRRLFSLAPLKNLGFLLFLLSGILIEISLNTPFIFLPDMMLQKGFEKQDAVWMLFIIGLVSTFSRIAIGFVADLPFVNRVKLCNSVVILNGVFVVFCPLCFSYASFIAFSVLFGFSAGSSSSLRYVLIPDLFGVDMIADFYGINMFFCAFAAFIGLPKAGALFDATDNYTVPFVVAGAELTISGIILFLIPAVQRCCRVPHPVR